MITIPIYTFVTIILITFALIGVMVHFTHKYQVMEKKLKSEVIKWLPDLSDEALNDLYKSGVLTKEEFEKAKKKLLN